MEVWTEESAGCAGRYVPGQDKIEWWVEGDKHAGTHKTNLVAGPKAGSFADYTAKADTLMQAKRLCLHWTPHSPINHWCIGHSVKIYNGQAPKGESSLVGEAVGWKAFSGSHGQTVQCHDVVYKGPDLVKKSCWTSLSGMANPAGNRVGREGKVDLSACEQACDSNHECLSFAFCSNDGDCELMDNHISGKEGFLSSAVCKTYYKSEGACNGGSKTM